MAGIYIHIPFCSQKCSYCGFYSIPDRSKDDRLEQQYTQALISEIKLRKNECCELIETVYFGGGTPSLMKVENLICIFEMLKKTFTIAEHAEITLEGNPETLSNNYLKSIRTYTPINRLSIGVQSFFEDDLLYLNRKHSPQQAINAIENAQKIGFERLSIDLIYGIPTLTEKKWLENLNRFFSFDISHLSAYALTIEPNTILEKQIQKRILNIPDEEQIEKHYTLLHEQLQKHNFEAYETSNFCKNRHYSKHNSNYWNLTKYIGFGASAHSFLGVSRSWNVADINAYITSISQKKIPCESEILTEDMQYNEYVMTAIRTPKGISLEFIQTHFNSRFLIHFQSMIQRLPTSWIIEQNKHFFTTPKGALFADLIAEKLFI